MTATHTHTTDQVAIARLHDVFASQQRSFRMARNPSVHERREQLEALASAVLAHRQQIRDALRADFLVHPDAFTDLVEVLGVANRAKFAAAQLDTWMAPETRDLDPGLYGSGAATIRHQPKGVVGNMPTWNFPFDLALGPLVEMLAAGNRVIIKPSEIAPSSAELLADIVSSTFDADHVAVVNGGLELAQTFSTLKWDHLLYTGSPAVGREIALSAAENLVPVTLELGGKNPVIVHSDSVDETTVEQVIGVKMIKNGQLCITADYCLVPRDQVETFIELAMAHVAKQVPGYANSGDCTGIVSQRHLDRLISLRDEASEDGARIVPLDGTTDIDPTTRQMALSLVVDPAEDLRLMQEEIFGPLLPVLPYDSLDEAIDLVNDGERPLGLYVFVKDPAVAEDILNRTSSGGACVNTAAVQGAIPSLGFGGSGNSGYGRHHGIEGFREFSNPRGVVVRGQGDLLPALFPPYDGLAVAAAKAGFDSISGESAPVNSAVAITSSFDSEREDLAAACRKLADSGLLIGTAGNVSARHGDLVAITATGVVLGNARPRDITMVTLDGEVVSGELAPTSELDLHLGIYRRFNAGAVVHTHAPMATALASVTDTLPVVHYQQLLLGGEIRVAPFHPFGTPEFAQAGLDALDGKNGALLANHGAVNFAPTLDKAVDNAELLEWACALYLNASQLGEPRALSKQQQKDVIDVAVGRRYGTTHSAHGNH